MRLIAFRPEYQITAETSRNRIFYKHYPELAQATDLPDYLTDWQEALDAMRPGFTILSDMTNLPTVSDRLGELLEQAQQLVAGREPRMVATVHAPNSETFHASYMAGAESTLPMRNFTDLWEADKFLDDLVAEAHI